MASRVHCAPPVRRRARTVVGIANARCGPFTRPRPDFPMSIQNDRWITQMAKEHGMIEPFEDRQVRQGVISYGVS